MAVVGPLAQHLSEISSGTRPIPTTNARRHHFVPAFMLKQFATPTKREGVMFELATSTGKTGKTTPDGTAFEKDLYAQGDEQDGSLDLGVEAFLSVVENYAAQAFEKLLADPAHFSPEDRQTLGLFLALQYSRTPTSLDHKAATLHTTMQMVMGIDFSNPDAFKKRHREIFEEPSTDDEIEALRRKMLKALANGEIAFEAPRTNAVQMTIGTADAVGAAICDMDWTLLRAKPGTGDLVSADQPMAMYDPTPKFVWSGHALLSSPNAETTIALRPDTSLLLTPGRALTREVEVGQARVDELNLRAYSWATQHIYGRRQDVLQGVRKLAKQKPHLLVTPRSSKPVILQEADPNDPAVGADNASRGWPRVLGVGDGSQAARPHSYTLVDPTDPKTLATALEGTDIGEELRRAAQKS